MKRFFIPKEAIKGNAALITGSEAHHILDVLRLKKRDRLLFFDNTGRTYEGRILDTRSRQVKVEIESAHNDKLRSKLETVLAQALPKGNKMDYIVQKTTELGVTAIIPVQTARTVVKLDRDKQLLRQRRWQRIAQEAAKQCGRTTVPQVKKITRWQDIVSDLSSFDLRVLLCLRENTRKLKEVLPGQKEVSRVVFFIGPEGDFTPEEIKQAEHLGCLAASLGPNVLKSDTAAVAALAMINYELN